LLGGKYWEGFRPKLHDALLDLQQPPGYWQAPDAEGKAFGPIYCTAMAVLALAVEKQQLSVHQRQENEKKK
jgi:hypothetical protein